jgi:starch synthase (maltosyl-transferring)
LLGTHRNEAGRQRVAIEGVTPEIDAGRFAVKRIIGDTRPRVVERLAKLGFTQSYTYFTWRNTKEELEDYFTTLRGYPLREYFRPNLWPNTPDILSEYLQGGGRSAFMVRAILAATLGASYGIYGPAFDLCENTPREPGSEEYLHSEKYEIKQWDWNAPWGLKDLLTRLNQIRRENPALQDDRNLRFHTTDNPLLICDGKSTHDRSNAVVVVANAGRLPRAGRLGDTRPCGARRR